MNDKIIAALKIVRNRCWNPHDPEGAQAFMFLNAQLFQVFYPDWDKKELDKTKND